MKNQLKNYLKIFVLLFGVSILLWNCEKEENIIETQTTTSFKAYRFNNDDIPQIASKIEQLSTQEVFTKSSDNNSKAYWVDDVNIFGAIDSVGNKSFSYRLYFNNMPKNVFYNIIITERVSNEISPFVIAFEIENDEKKSIRYYELEYFLDALTERDEKSKSGSYSKNDHTNDGILDFTDCGELTSGSSGGSESSNTSGGGGNGNGGYDPNGSSNSGNSYTSYGSYTVYSYGGGGGGGGVTINTGNAEIVAVDAKSNDDRVICPEGEVIIVENSSSEEIIITPELEVDYPCQSEKIKNIFVETAPLSQLILDIFDSDSSGYNLVFDVDEALEDTDFQGITGNTSENSEWDLDKLDITIGLNPDLLNNGTDLAIATTIIHESVHAVLLYMLETGKITIENANGDRSMTMLVDSYVRFRIIQEEFGGVQPTDASEVDNYMHEYMTGLVESIGTSISEYGNSEGYNIAFSYYKKLAWHGLEANLEMLMFDDEDIDEAEEAELLDINNTLFDEFENRPNAKGTKCSN